MTVYTGFSLELGSITCARDTSAVTPQHKPLRPVGKVPSRARRTQHRATGAAVAIFLPRCLLAAEDGAANTPTPPPGCRTGSRRAALPQPAERGDPFPTTQSQTKGQPNHRVQLGLTCNDEERGWWQWLEGRGRSRETPESPAAAGTGRWGAKCCAVLSQSCTQRGCGYETRRLREEGCQTANKTNPAGARNPRSVWNLRVKLGSPCCPSALLVSPLTHSFSHYFTN